jgi:hypothetical protein
MRNIAKIIVVALVVISCKKAYLPPASSSPNSYMVVEGVINTGADSTIIRLSRTVNLNNKVTKNPLTGAVITVESDQNNIYPLTETVKGTYVNAGLNLSSANKYRLNIKTIDNKQYQSDFVAVNNTPPIDSLGYTINNNMLQVYTNTHDVNNNTHYYRWDYTETWLFDAQYQSQFITTGTELVSRTPAQQVYTCWASDTSSTILLGSSAKLSQDVIYQAPITQVLSTSEKLETKYSILLHEYGLSSDAYNFWTNIKKNTEQLGSIFDAQPSSIAGNIHNVANPAEPVIGYVSATLVQSKRIFILRDKLPNTWKTTYPYTCAVDSNYFSHPVTGYPDVQNNLIHELPNIGPIQITLMPFFFQNGSGIEGYLGSTSECADCTIRGTTTKPAFWQ